jgi:hypothetical protein
MEKPKRSKRAPILKGLATPSRGGVGTVGVVRISTRNALRAVYSHTVFGAA